MYRGSITECNVWVYFNLNSVIYSYTPEAFPPGIRGTAVGIASALGKLFGAVAPIVTGYLIEIKLEYALYLAVGMFVVSGLMMSVLPIETRARRVEIVIGE